MEMTISSGKIENQQNADDVLLVKRCHNIMGDTLNKLCYQTRKYSYENKSI